VIARIRALAVLLLVTLAVSIARVPARADGAGYLIHGGDLLHVAVVGEKDLTGDVHVVADGTISLPLCGIVRVGGLTPDAAAHAIAVALQRYLRTPDVSVNVETLGQITVLVSGAVTTPGSYTLKGTSHVSDALAAAGGLSAKLRGTYPDGWLEPQSGSSQKIATEALIRGGDQQADLALHDGDDVYIPAPPTIRVTVLGAVDIPGEVDMYAGQRLSVALSTAGTSGESHADLSRVTVTRTEPDGKSAVHQIDLYRAIDGTHDGGKVDLRYDPVLREDDVVYVPMTARTRGMLTNALFLLTTLAGY